MLLGELGFVVVISVHGDGVGERRVGGIVWGPLDTGLDLCQWCESFCRVVCVVVFVLLSEHYLYCFLLYRSFLVVRFPIF